MLENETRMESFPYSSTEQEYEKLYDEHTVLKSTKGK
jgi:hypothetical protein